MYVKALGRKKWEVLEHPDYRRDLSPCDYHIFGLLKKKLMGQRFHSDDDIKAAVLNWFDDQPTSFFADAIRNIPKRSDAMVISLYKFYMHFTH
ncbi:histone-lysine N-methyltransferase SETMAR [Trichonephila clavipes]|nr:histone-lysine N-methyltransferase SETMAR [Trichonephila clavipes]